jgi:lipoate-protein ligase A
MANHESVSWRLILDGEYSGAWNMARDEALLLSQNASTLPVLRFYSWNPACVSIGRLQKNFDFSPLQNSPFDCVRRPTGGRAVLHQHEITYCAVVHQEFLPREARSVVGAYNWLSAGFLEGFRILGLDAQLAAPHKASTPLAANCFQAAAQCDFLVGGRKLIGASQCRKGNAILQHGAILLEVDESAWHKAVGGAMDGATSLRALGVLASREQIIAALAEGMARAHAIYFAPGSLTVQEHGLASRLHTSKYTSSRWNEQGELPQLFS